MMNEEEWRDEKEGEKKVAQNCSGAKESTACRCVRLNVTRQFNGEDAAQRAADA